MGDGVVLFEGLLNLHGQGSLLRDTAVSKKQNFKARKLTSLLKVRCDSGLYTIREQAGDRGGGGAGGAISQNHNVAATSCMVYTAYTACGSYRSDDGNCPLLFRAVLSPSQIEVKISEMQFDYTRGIEISPITMRQAP